MRRGVEGRYSTYNGLAKELIYRSLTNHTQTKLLRSHSAQIFKLPQHVVDRRKGLRETMWSLITSSLVRFRSSLDYQLPPSYEKMKTKRSIANVEYAICNVICKNIEVQKLATNVRNNLCINVWLSSITKQNLFFFRCKQPTVYTAFLFGL